MIGTIQKQLGARAESLLGFKTPRSRRNGSICPDRNFVERIFGPSDRNNRVLRESPAHLRAWTPREHRLCVHPPRGPGHRALGRRPASAKNPDYFDGENIVSWPSRAAATRWLRPTASWARRAQVRSTRSPSCSSSTTASCSRTRTRPTRSCMGTMKQAADMGLCRGRRDDLLWLGRERAADCGGQPGVCAGARAGPGHRVVVLPSATTPSRSRVGRQGHPTTTFPPTHRPGESPRRDDPGRHHQAEAAGEQRGLRGAADGRLELRQVRQEDLHRTVQRSSD